MPGMKITDRGYAAFRDKQAAIMKRKREAGFEIGQLPPVANPIRKAEARQSLRAFNEIYLTRFFTDEKTGRFWPWSQTHIDLMRMIEDAIFEGEQDAIMMPRGSGKTSHIKAGAIWGILYGYISWLCVLAATAPLAYKIIAAMQMILETNELLAADFPEAIFPIMALERNALRARKQTYFGKLTRIIYNEGEIVFPDIPGSPCAQAIITGTGLEGSGIRGQVKSLPNGSQRRPTFVFCDDPQTRESAKSEMQTADRIALLDSDVLQMGPPGSPISAMLAGTVIRRGDAMDKIAESPKWESIRRRMLLSMPLHWRDTPPDVPRENWWDMYADLMLNKKTSQARSLYAEHRPTGDRVGCLEILDEPRPCKVCEQRSVCMDAEAVTYWKYRQYPKDLSPIQTAMNIAILTPDVFASEMQQQPLEIRLQNSKITPAQMVQKVNGLAREHVPPDATVLSIGVDVGQEILHYVVAAFEPDFTGYVTRYGTFPEQPVKWFLKSNPPRPLSSVYREEVGGNSDEDGIIAWGLERLCGTLLKHEFERHMAGSITPVQADIMLVDRGYKPRIIYLVRRKLGTPIMRASLGLPLPVTAKPIDAYQKKPGWRIGDNWYIPNIKNTREYPHVCVDTNEWKCRIHSALCLQPGSAGSLSLYGTAATMSDHEPFAAHVAGSEYDLAPVVNGRQRHQYKVLPGGPDNDWLDALMHAAVGASIMGCKFPEEAKGEIVNPAGPRKFLTLAEMKGQ